MLYIIIQSSIARPDELAERIGAFLHEFRNNTLENMSEEEFNDYMKSLAAIKEEPEKTLSDRFKRFQGEISNKTMEFRRTEGK